MRRDRSRSLTLWCEQKAGGDVKRKGQQDPYAYLPLSSIGGGKKKGGADKVKYNITGKR